MRLCAWVVFLVSLVTLLYIEVHYKISTAEVALPLLFVWFFVCTAFLLSAYFLLQINRNNSKNSVA
jgi:uncharacterized protein with PQ loop repeat